MISNRLFSSFRQCSKLYIARLKSPGYCCRYSVTACRNSPSGHNVDYFEKKTPSARAILAPNLNFVRLYAKQSGDNPASGSKDERFENVMTIPNVLTVSRIFMCPVLGHLVISNSYTTALGLLFIAGITDVLDGWIARTYPSQSSLAGSFLDPMADKLLIGTLFITLTCSGLIPVPLTLLIIGRDCLLIAGGFVIRYISLPQPKTFRRYFDVTLVTAQLAPTVISKYNTAVQLLLVGTTLGVAALQCSPEILHIMWYATGTTTVLSGLSYVFAKNTYRVLRPRANEKINEEK